MPAFILAILLLANTAWADWYTYTPAGSVDGRGILQEMMSRCPQYGLRQIRGMDKATQCHEATHFVDGEISREVGQDYGAFYVGEGKCYILPPPQVTVGMVARYVPQQQQTSTFRTYLTGDRTQRNCLSLVDEWTCYANDAQCTQELRLLDDGGLKRAMEFSGFVDVLVQAVQSHDPNYSGMKRLVEFVAWQKSRVSELAKAQTPTQPPLIVDSPTHRTIQASFVADLAPEWRHRNRGGSCVHMSTAHILRYMGLHDEADQWLRQYRGGESPGPHKRKLDASGLEYAMTTDADDEFLQWCLDNRLMMGVTTKPGHCLNLVGKIERNGQPTAVLLDNNRPGQHEYEDWDSWYRKYKRSGWAFTILSGEVPPPLPVLRNQL